MPKKALDAIKTENTNLWFGTPTMYVDILDLPESKDFSPRQGGYKGIMGGSLCPEQLLRDLKDTFNCQVFVAYGTTENSPCTFMSLKTDSVENQTKTVGYIMPHTEAKVIDDNDKMVNREEIGELCIRGPCIFAGYWNQPEKTKEVMTDDGWYKTGDLAIITDDGYCKIVGRSKDMIIRGGENIYPAEVESTLLTHQSIIDAQVVAVPSKRLGEEVAAYVRLGTGKSLTEEELKEFCFEKMAHFKVPKYVKFVDHYPLTVTGKIRKVELRKMAKMDFDLDI